MVVAAGFAWNYGYHNRNSNDNMPNLHSIAQMDEAEVNNILSGYKRTQLLEVWGAPEYSNSSEDVWLLDDIACLTVNYKNDSEKVVICGIGPMLFPVGIKEITETVDSSDNSRQLSPEEITDVKDWALGLDLVYIDFPDREDPTKSMQEEKAIHSISITEKKYFPICISMTTMFLSMVFGGKSF